MLAFVNLYRCASNETGPPYFLMLAELCLELDFLDMHTDGKASHLDSERLKTATEERPYSEQDDLSYFLGSSLTY